MFKALKVTMSPFSLFFSFFLLPFAIFSHLINCLMVFPARSQLELLMPAWMIGVSSTALSGFPKSCPGRCSIPHKTCAGFSLLLSASSSFPNPGLHPYYFLKFLVEIFPFDFPFNDSEVLLGNSSPCLLS